MKFLEVKISDKTISSEDVLNTFSYIISVQFLRPAMSLSDTASETIRNGFSLMPYQVFSQENTETTMVIKVDL